MLSREYARNKYSEILGLPIEHPIVQNLEKHTTNWAYYRSVNDKSYKYIQRYKHKFLSICFHKNSFCFVHYFGNKLFRITTIGSNFV